MKKKQTNKTKEQKKHADFMEVTLSLARRGLGNVWPNPAVGCLIVSNGRVVGRGWTQPGGRPHAELMALKQAGKNANGGVAYVNLEPCNHKGKSPPCTEALIAAGIREIYASLPDPDPRVSGKGFKRLRAARVGVNIGLLDHAATEINRGFFLRIEQGRPMITLKTATTMDGKIATRDGQSQWITDEEARGFAHALRARHDAILIGSGTAVADDPLLTSRLPGIDDIRRPRVILDGRLRLPCTSKLVSTVKESPVWVVTRDDHPPHEYKKYKDLDIELILVPFEKWALNDVGLILNELGGRGLTRVLVEGGNKLTSSLFAADLIDQLIWFRAPKVMGNDGLPFIGDLGLVKLSEIQKFVRQSVAGIGPDQVEILNRNR